MSEHLHDWVFVAGGFIRCNYCSADGGRWGRAHGDRGAAFYQDDNLAHGVDVND